MQLKMEIEYILAYNRKMSKIIVFGFPHSGTSILKSIIGHIDNVEEIINETNIITKETTKKYILCKYPYTIDEFFSKAYSDYIKIFIIRHPFHVFSSINKRFNYKINPKQRHSIKAYNKMLNKFIYYKNHPMTNLYIIRYEGLFPNNFQKLKEIFNQIGFTYTDKIFDNTKYDNKIINGVQTPNYKPPNIEHELYRTWQINQPFANNNDPNKIDLMPEQEKEIKSIRSISHVYKDII